MSEYEEPAFITRSRHRRDPLSDLILKLWDDGLMRAAKAVIEWLTTGRSGRALARYDRWVFSRHSDTTSP